MLAGLRTKKLTFNGLGRDRGPEKNGGGVVVYMKENMYAYRRLDLEVNGIEAIWVQIKINGNKVLYGTFMYLQKVTLNHEIKLNIR